MIQMTTFFLILFFELFGSKGWSFFHEHKLKTGVYQSIGEGQCDLAVIDQSEQLITLQPQDSFSDGQGRRFECPSKEPLYINCKVSPSSRPDLCQFTSNSATDEIEAIWVKLLENDGFVILNSNFIEQSYYFLKKTWTVKDQSSRSEEAIYQMGFGKEKSYQCKIGSSSHSLVSAAITFTPSITGEIATGRLSLLNGANKSSTINFSGPIKLPKSDAYDKSVMLLNRTNCAMWPLCDEYALKFTDFTQRLNFKDLSQDLHLLYESITGPMLNRAHDSSVLKCTLLQ